MLPMTGSYCFLIILILVMVALLLLLLASFEIWRSYKGPLAKIERRLKTLSAAGDASP
jgi:hypothetical protein